MFWKAVYRWEITNMQSMVQCNNLDFLCLWINCSPQPSWITMYVNGKCIFFNLILGLWHIVSFYIGLRHACDIKTSFISGDQQGVQKKCSGCLKQTYSFQKFHLNTLFLMHHTVKVNNVSCDNSHEAKYSLLSSDIHIPMKGLLLCY